MKKFIILLALAFIGANLNAQKPIVVSEDTVSFKNAKYPGIVLAIPEFNFESTQKNWIKQLQSGTKSKVVTENQEMTIFGANMKDISPNPINIYSKFINRDTILLLETVFELSKDKFIEKANGENELTQAKLFLKQFAKDQYTDRVEDELASEKKILKDLMNQQESLQDKKMKMQKSIQSNKVDSLQAADNVKVLNSEIEKLTEEIMQQNSQLASMEKGVVRDQKTDYVKSIEKNKRKAFNEVESLSKKIVKLHSENEQYNNDIVKNVSDQEVMKGKVAQQDLIVKKCQDKLTTVKGF